MHDVVVVGAGPAGLICAAELQKRGIGALVIERDKRIGEPVECAGLFNIDGLERLGIKRGKYVLNEIAGVRIYSPCGALSEIKAKSGKAYVAGRGEFDRFLANEYRGEISVGDAVTGAKRSGDSWKLKSSSGAVEAKRVVLATGYDCSLHKGFGMGSPEKFFHTSQYEIEGMSLEKDLVELYVGSVAPGFFAWVIPVNESTARVGVGTLDAPGPIHNYMEGFLKRLKSEGRFNAKNKIVHKSGGLIPLYDPGLSVSGDNVYLVGDAAGQVKATTGGGVMIGGLCAKALARCLHDGTDYASSLAEMNKELGNHLLIRRVMNRFGDEQYEHMIEFLNKPEIKKLIEERGDMDFTGPLIEGALKNPLVLMQAMKFMGKGALGGMFF